VTSLITVLEAPVWVKNESRLHDYIIKSLIENTKNTDRSHIDFYTNFRFKQDSGVEFMAL